MRRDELTELHYITPIDNVASILEHGLLSHRRVARLRHHSVAMSEIQDRRARVVVPSGRPLHDYVNLYICARNPMLSKVRNQHEGLCVLRVSSDVVDIRGAVVADRNASSDYVRFGPAPDALVRVDRDRVCAESWLHPDDRIDEWRHKSQKCAEILVPDRVDPGYIGGAYVSCVPTKVALAQVAPTLPTVVDPHFFFRW